MSVSQAVSVSQNTLTIHSPFPHWCLYPEAHVPWLRQLVIDLSVQSRRFDPKPVHVGFVASIVPLGQFYLLNTLAFSCWYHSINTHCLYIQI
jgi:hypothetical protein